MSLVITVPPVRVGPIHLEGVSAPLESKVQRAADHETGGAYGTESSAKNVEHAIELLYGDEGYAAAKVHAARSGNPVTTNEAIDIPLSVTIDEGRLYKLGSIRLPPNALVTQAEIDKEFGAQTSLAKGQTLRATWFMIASRYKSKGYLDCTVTPHPEFDETAGAVNYTVEINPGPVYHLAFVKFENVSDELRSRMMRVWQMLPGDPFDESYVSSFIVRVQKEDPGLQRTLAGVRVTYDVHADQQTHDVNCIIHFARAQQGQ
jgi:outer membrane protein assembly factor BamA